MQPTEPKSSAKQQVLDFVRSRCPETMELKFGCEVRVHILDNRDHERDVVIDDRITNGEVRLGYFGDVSVSDIEILGSDLQLHHLLIAFAWAKNICVYPSGLITETPSDTEYEICTFDLTQNLHSQTPEFYEAILPLIPNDERNLQTMWHRLSPPTKGKTRRSPTLQW